MSRVPMPSDIKSRDDKRKTQRRDRKQQLADCADAMTQDQLAGAISQTGCTLAELGFTRERLISAITAALNAETVKYIRIAQYKDGKLTGYEIEEKRSPDHAVRLRAATKFLEIQAKQEGAGSKQSRKSPVKQAALDKLEAREGQYSQPFSITPEDRHVSGK